MPGTKQLEMEAGKTESVNRRRLLQLLTLYMAGPIYLSQDLFTSEAFAQTDVPQTGKAIHVPAGSGENGKIGEGDIAFKFNKQQTWGHVGVIELELPIGLLGAPPHAHKTFDEICRVTQGELTILVGNDLFQVKAGDWHLRPRGIVHSFWNTGSQPAKFIELYAPAGHEAYMTALSHLFKDNQRPKPGDLDKLAKTYDIHFDWPKLKEIMDTYHVRL